MTSLFLSASHVQIGRQVAHWSRAVEGLEDFAAFAAPAAWEALEQYTGSAIRQSLGRPVIELKHLAALAKAKLDRAQTQPEFDQVRKQVLKIRRGYLRIETTLDFFGDAINTRTSAELATHLRALDTLAGQSMLRVLKPLGKQTPPVLVYVDKGLGAAILKAGLRLWDGSINPVAAIKVVRHNLWRPTALIHEAGHQVAHIIGWNDELAASLGDSLSETSTEIAEVWAAWASEIAADAFAFAHTGYAAVAALHDVLDGDDDFVFRFTLGDPHPISYIRVLLGTAMCSQFFGVGPWDDLARTWMQNHPLENVPRDVRAVIERSMGLLPRVVSITLQSPMRAFGGHSLSDAIDPLRVSPAVLMRLERQVGAALYTSTHWLSVEGLRLLALSGLRTAISPTQEKQSLERFADWLVRLGGLSRHAA